RPGCVRRARLSGRRGWVSTDSRDMREILMRIMYELRSVRLGLVAALIGTLSLAQGCAGDPNAVAGTPISKERQDAERDARAKAYGKGMPLGKNGRPVKSSAR